MGAQVRGARRGGHRVVDDLEALVRARPPTKFVVLSEPADVDVLLPAPAGAVARPSVRGALAGLLHRDRRPRREQERGARVAVRAPGRAARAHGGVRRRPQRRRHAALGGAGGGGRRGGAGRARRRRRRGPAGRPAGAVPGELAGDAARTERPTAIAASGDVARRAEAIETPERPKAAPGGGAPPSRGPGARWDGHRICPPDGTRIHRFRL